MVSDYRYACLGAPASVSGWHVFLAPNVQSNFAPLLFSLIRASVRTRKAGNTSGQRPHGNARFDEVATREFGCGLPGRVGIPFHSVRRRRCRGMSQYVAVMVSTCPAGRWPPVPKDSRRRLGGGPMGCGLTRPLLRTATRLGSRTQGLKRWKPCLFARMGVPPVRGVWRTALPWRMRSQQLAFLHGFNIYHPAAGRRLGPARHIQRSTGQFSRPNGPVAAVFPQAFTGRPWAKTLIIYAIWIGNQENRSDIARAPGHPCYLAPTQPTWGGGRPSNSCRGDAKSCRHATAMERALRFDAATVAVKVPLECGVIPVAIVHRRGVSQWCRRTAILSSCFCMLFPSNCRHAPCSSGDPPCSR